MLAACASAPRAAAAPRATYAVEEKSIDALEADLAAGRVTSVELVRAYRARIARIDGTLRSVLALNPAALEPGRGLGRGAAARRALGPLAGVPVLLKDNIETADPVADHRRLPGAEGQRLGPRRAAGRAAAGGGRDHPGQDQPSEWANYPLRALDQRLERGGRPDAQPLRPRPQRLRLELRLRRGGGGEPRGGDRRHRDGRVGHLPGGDQRARRAEAHGRA